MTRRTDKYGQAYWCIGVPESIAPDGQIYAMACRAEVDQTGALILWRDSRLQQDDTYAPMDRPAPNLAFAAGQWRYFFAASLMDGSAVAVEHWKGEVAERGKS